MKTGNSLIDDAVIIIPEHCENCDSGERSNHTGTNIFDCETCSGTGRIEVGIPAITWLHRALKHFQVYASEIKPKAPAPMTEELWPDSDSDELHDIDFRERLFEAIRTDPHVRAAILDVVTEELHTYAGALVRKAPLPPLTDEQRAGLQETRDYLTECIEDNERTNNDD